MLALKSSPLLEKAFPRITRNPGRALVLVALGVAVLTVSARIQVPFWPVSMSMQSFAVLVLSFIYGSRLGTASVVSYLALGVIGAPVFVNGGGVPYFWGPTTGYLLGFALAAWIVGSLSERGALQSWRSTFVTMLIGDAIILVMGATWLSTLIGIERAFYAGLLIFLPAEALKIVLATVLARLAHRAA